MAVISINEPFDDTPTGRLLEAIIESRAWMNSTLTIWGKKSPGDERARAEASIYQADRLMATGKCEYWMGAKSGPNSSLTPNRPLW